MAAMGIRCFKCSFKLILFILYCITKHDNNGELTIILLLIKHFTSTLLHYIISFTVNSQRALTTIIPNYKDSLVWSNIQMFVIRLIKPWSGKKEGVFCVWVCASGSICQLTLESGVDITVGGGSEGHCPGAQWSEWKFFFAAVFAAATWLLWKRYAFVSGARQRAEQVGRKGQAWAVEREDSGTRQ